MKLSMNCSTEDKLLEIFNLNGVFELLSSLEKIEVKNDKLIEHSKSNIKTLLIINIDSGKTITWNQTHQPSLTLPDTIWELYFQFNSGNIYKCVSHKAKIPGYSLMVRHNSDVLSFKSKYSKNIHQIIDENWFNGLLINEKYKTIMKDHLKLQVYYYEFDNQLV